MGRVVEREEVRRKKKGEGLLWKMDKMLHRLLKICLEMQPTLLLLHRKWTPHVHTFHISRTCTDTHKHAHLFLYIYMHPHTFFWAGPGNKAIHMLHDDYESYYLPTPMIAGL